MKSLCVGLAIAGAVAGVASAQPDLTIKHAPVRLRMRAVAQSIEPVLEPKPEPKPDPKPDAVTTASASATGDFHPLPQSSRDFEERVILKVRAGVELDGAPASGQPLRGGAALPPGFSGSRPWIAGDAVIGARDLFLPSLGAYLLSSFQFDAGDTVATRSALVVPGDASDQRIAIKAGYAEWGRDARADAEGKHLWLRAGRQFRLDGGGMFAYFDGATIGYREHAWDASVFAGERVALYVDTTRGFTFGATGSVDLKKLKDIPLKLGVDYLGLAINQLGGDVESISLRQMAAITAVSDLGDAMHVDGRVRFVDNGTGLGLGRIGGRLRREIGKELVVAADVEQRFGADVAYDLASPSAVDIVDVARRLGVGLATPIDALAIGGRVDWRRNKLEILGFARADLPESTPSTVDQQGYLEVGAAAAMAPLPGVWAEAQYLLRDYFVRDASNQMGSAFRDTAGSGLSTMHELSADVTYATSSGAITRWRFGAGAFYRIYDLVTPYVATAHDGRGGGRGSVQYWFTRKLHADVSGEVAQSSPTLQRDLGTVTAVRAAVEARW